MNWKVAVIIIVAFTAGMTVREFWMASADAQPLAAPKGSTKRSAHPASLYGFMKNRLNPALTRASYTVFHGSVEVESSEYEAAVKDLLQSTEALVHYSEYFADSIPAFQSYSADLRSATRSFGEAALQGDRNAAQHWLEHIRSTCNSCHQDFRD